MKTKMKVIIKALPIIAYSIIMSLLIYSCEKNEEIGTSTIAKSDTYTEKADLKELITKMGDKDLELIELIKNNPISKLKNQELLKSNLESSTMYFDTNHIQAIKNDKDQAVYMIPVYYNNNRDTNIYTLSISVDENFIDSKLTTLEINADGTLQYNTQIFNYLNKKSQTSRGIKELECYCTVSISDCTCHTRHADGGCDHPDISVFCSSCSGSGSSGNTSTNPETSPTSTVIGAVWSNSSSYGYSYTQTGSSIYIALYKIFRTTYTLSALQKYNIVNFPEISGTLLNFLNAEGSSQANKDFVLSVINAVEEGTVENVQDANVLINAYKKASQLLIENLKYSQKSPMDIDIIDILAKTNLPENQKFKDVYVALTQSPEFQKLFIDIFNDSKRNNVKFEIAEHVYEDNDPTKKEVNATTSQDQVTKKITIKINKQILIAGTTKSQTKIENAKTILHECIHAYLFVKANNPTVGVDFVKILNTMYPTVNEQHDFMYTKMIPTMQKVLGEIRDLVTTTVGRAEVEQRTMHPTFIPLTSTPWIWTEYYKYISINGLEEATCFKEDFPKDSDKWKLLVKYIEYGHNDLQP